MGIALESKRLDKLEEAVHRAPDTVAILRYALRVCQRVVASKDFRFQASIHKECFSAGLILLCAIRQGLHHVCCI